MLAWNCAHHYFLFVGATDPDPKNQEPRMTVAGVPCVGRRNFNDVHCGGRQSFEKGQRQCMRMGLMSGTEIIKT